jgi:hypothetical protein
MRMYGASSRKTSDDVSKGFTASGRQEAYGTGSAALHAVSVADGHVEPLP